MHNLPPFRSAHSHKRMQQLPSSSRHSAMSLLWSFICVFLAGSIVTQPCTAYSVRKQQHHQQSVSHRTGDNGIKGAGCPHDRLVAYKVVLHTYWSRELFPKHYPDWRPSAQWTKTVGRSHDSSFNLYSLGQPASPAMKTFVETGRSDGLEQWPQSRAADKSNVLDEFSIPAITSGSGRSEVRIFMDSNHTLVSLVARIVPSPDWFVGVDSFQLCVGGSWMDSVTVELDPLDAGTDNGFTFTAPNWPTDPQGIVYRMTSHYPSHPAGSFYYPQNKRLPPIATFQFIKHKEFELSEVFGFAEDSRKYETVQSSVHLDDEHNHFDLNNELSADIELERQHEMAFTKPAVRLTEKDRIRAKLLARLNESTNLTTFSIDDGDTHSSSNSIAVVSAEASRLIADTLDATAHAYVVPRNNKTAILAGIAQRYSSTVKKVYRKHPHHRLRKDCRVGHWSDWSGCSQTCGIGEMQRNRKVIKPARRGGRPCPPLQESKWCGSALDCSTPEAHFKW